MKRPFVWLCIVFTMLLAVMKTTEDPWEGSPPDLACERLLKESAGGEITASGIVAECSAVSKGLRLSVNHITIETKENSKISLLPNLKIIMTIEYGEIAPGDMVWISGAPAGFETASNPGQFDMRAYYFAENTVCSLKNPRILKLQKGKISLARLLYYARRALQDSYGKILEEKAAKTAAAISLGEKGLMESEWKETYQEGGIAHILAVSGLHVTLIGMSLYRLMRRAGLPFGACGAISGAAVLLYAAMTGFGISASRAAFMFLIWLGAQICGRKYDMATAAAVAAAALLLQDAENLCQSSFLLSFGAVLSIAVLVPCILETCRMKTALGKTILSGLGIWFGTLPATLFFFYQVSPWSILVNLAVIPLMSVVMATGLIACFVGLLSVFAGTFLAAPVYYLLGCFEWMCRLEQRMPLPVWVAGKPGIWQVILYYGVILLAAFILQRKDVSGESRKKGGKRGCKAGRSIYAARFLWIFCSIACLFLASSRKTEDLEIVCLDVGQGDAALVRLPSGENCLIDGGSTSKSKIWKYIIGQAVKYYGIRTLDYIFLSHADRDHISGIMEFLQEYAQGFGGKNVHGITLKYLILPPTADETDFRELKELASGSGITVLAMEAGSCIKDRSAGDAIDKRTSSGCGEKSGTSEGRDVWSISCIAPASSGLTGDRNEDSMVLMLQYGRFRMLFTGDLEGEAEKHLAEHSETGRQLGADILKVGHHGSSGGSSEIFLGQVRPRIAVISCGKDNSYGHPAKETLSRLQNAGCRILETQKQGAVTIRSDGETFSVETYKDTH